jgi:AcrR family transcriptional regulator
MSTTKTKPWIEIGYQLVAESGFNKLSVELISRKVGKNKSSFYHHFGELNVLISELLSHHLQRAKLLATELEGCESIRPGMIHVFLQFKVDFLFHKQLRIERGNADFERCFEEVHALFESAIEEIWAEYLQMGQQKQLSKTFLRLVSENFLLQITEENYTFDWLNSYLSEVAGMLNQLKPK